MLLGAEVLLIAVRLSCHGALAQLGTQPSAAGRTAGEDQQAGGETPQPVHRASLRGPGLQLHQQRVLQEAAGGQHRQAAGLVEHQ